MTSLEQKRDVNHHYFGVIGIWLITWLALSCTTSENDQPKYVFITDTGSKFHLEECRHLKYSKHIIALDSAMAKGYGACKICEPLSSGETVKIRELRKVNPPPAPVKPLSKAIRCSARNNSGIQCKRMTKNPSGKCWQHKD